MKVLTLFNHKGGVGKTTLAANLAEAIQDAGKRVLLVDTDPQCNLSSFYLTEKDLDKMLGESSEGSGAGSTVWTAIEPVVLGRGEVREVEPVEIRENLFLLVGDVLLSQYEEELPSAWTESFARKKRGYDVMCALSRVARSTAEDVGADLLIYDVGPNVGALNRTVLLDCDYFLTPVHTDLYSLRALTTVGRSVARWVRDWQTVRELASASEKVSLLKGQPQYLGYVSSAFKEYGGQKAEPHEYWERMIPARVKLRVIDELKAVNSALVPAPPYKLGDVPNFNSLAAASQQFGVPIGDLRGLVNSGKYPKVDEIREVFASLAHNVTKQMGL
ncbi:MAG: ParA family protein [Betaproteobacteria bacterium]|nr:ParA family protein [Betaproteobacteria bacterium]